MKKKFFLINILLLFTSIYLGLIIFHIDIKSFFKKSICDRCNVILVSLDTLGGNHLPCYGYKKNTAQNLCNFAKENIFFTHAFSNASWTLPSHYSIFTSLYPNHHNLISADDDNELADSTNTMTEFFKKTDYKTIYIGPLDDRTLPLKRGLSRGFDTTSPAGSSLSGWDKGIDQLIKNNDKKQSTFLFLHTYWVHSPYVVNSVPESNGERIFTNDYYEDIPTKWEDYTKFSQAFLDYILSQYKSKINKKHPISNKEYQNRIDSLEGAKDLNEAEKIYNEEVSDPISRDINFVEFYYSQIRKSPRRVLYAKALYDEMIYYLDKRLTKIFDLASNTKLADNTIIIITSDHGEEFMEHGSLAHLADHLYDTTTTIPLIMYVPGIKNKKIDNLVQSIDLLPTILNLTGLKNPENHFDGLDLTDSLLGRKQAQTNKYLISEGPNDSIRNNRWKLYVNNRLWESNTHELYDLKSDPEEKNNLAKKEQKIAEDLYNNLKKIIYKK